MPTYKFEAMDTAGGEVKDAVDAPSEEEAQQKIKQMGYFVTKITEVSTGKKKGKGKAGRRKRKGQVFTIGGVSTKQLCTFTPACPCCAASASSSTRCAPACSRTP